MIVSDRGKDLKILLEAILQSTPDATIIVDEHGTIQATSQSTSGLFHYPENEMIGKNVSMLMGGADHAHHDRYMTNYLETGAKQIIGKGRVVEAKLADGSIIPVHLTIGEANIEGQRYFTGYIRDLTAQQKADHRITELQVELENFSRLSTVGTMASAMAHELNQPLTAVANYMEAARDMLDDPDKETLAMVREALDAAGKQSVRAGQIVRKLRDYVSRGEFEMRPTDLHDIVSNAVSLAKVGVEGPVPRIIAEIPADLPLILADTLQIRQVVLNLIRNAIDALSDTENPLIWVTAWTEGDAITIEVKDNGPGLDLDDGRSPFEPFLSTKSTGMGLGLAICQTIVEAHGGQIWTETEEGQGAIFRLTLATASERAQS